MKTEINHPTRFVIASDVFDVIGNSIASEERTKIMRTGYYVVTEDYEYWCPTKSCAHETQKEFGGEIITAEERYRRCAKKANQKSKMI